jgi:hypothetical protein
MIGKKRLKDAYERQPVRAAAVPAKAKRPRPELPERVQEASAVFGHGPGVQVTGFNLTPADREAIERIRRRALQLGVDDVTKSLVVRAGIAELDAAGDRQLVARFSLLRRPMPGRPRLAPSPFRR